ADEVADIEIAEQRKFVSELVGARVELDAARAIHQMRERGLAVVAHGDESTRQADGPHGLQLGVGSLLQTPGELTRPLRHRVAAAERIDPSATKRLELVVPLAHDVVRVALAHAFPRAHSRYALMNSSRSPSMTASTLPISTPVR